MNLPTRDLVSSPSMADYEVGAAEAAAMSFSSMAVRTPLPVYRQEAARLDPIPLPQLQCLGQIWLLVLK